MLTPSNFDLPRLEPQHFQECGIEIDALHDRVALEPGRTWPGQTTTHGSRVPPS